MDTAEGGVSGLGMCSCCCVQVAGIRLMAKMCCNLQSSDGEDGDESDFLTAPKVQASDDGYRQNNERKISNDVDACVGAVQPVSICDLSKARE
jgi:hypothetical protein